MTIKKAVFFGILTPIIIYSLFLGFDFLSKPGVEKPEAIVASFQLTPTQIINSLPDRHLIKTFFIPQSPEKDWSQPWQDACEEASLLTVNYYYSSVNPDPKQLLDDYQEIFNFESKNQWGHDVNLSQMAQVGLDLFGLKSKIIENPDLKTIKEYLVKDIPIIITANGKTLFSENKHFKAGGPWYHSLVILGFDDQKSQFIVHDVGTQFGAYFRYSYQLLLNSIHDWPATGQKENINTGRQAVLILLK
ncbi:MAG: C39 family peptidase [Candidatus Shapirobacteria bacterium]|jgi:hypothetical protein